MMERVEDDVLNYVMRPYRTQEPYQLTEHEKTQLDQKNQVFNALSEEFPVSLGKEVSHKERDERTDLEMDDSTLTYGEVDFVSIGEIFAAINNRYGGIPKGGKFYDLGSGTGKGVVAAALLHNFEECIGIELLQGLYGISCSLKNKYDSEFPKIAGENPDLFESVPKVTMIQGDILEDIWKDASFIFGNSTCFDDYMMETIGSVEVAPGTLAISLTKPFSSGHWHILEKTKKRMSWGEATVYIQRKVDPQQERLDRLEFGRALSS